ncbi:hypothetical protein, partial [Paenibacillus sp. IITD108]|uniref:hypothetical protein n=1 Tax=Paenibacillus sp. IITD108 TaxID=3116649 RepID=UPI002F4007EC
LPNEGSFCPRGQVILYILKQAKVYMFMLTFTPNWYAVWETNKASAAKTKIYMRSTSEIINADFLIFKC